ncbi:hypothetical protein ATY81_23505 [Rhizobium sp. R72]|uniref:TIR domain-containing protein n=1 Tax=unclassified Rhizobium TaxID=2613769 RepID=UPI000B535095|nr:MULTISPECIES: toll/interleukin-1 receptor domain-containing protein [unclassified Rhizobium]OWW01914.1 hypothetical protein ATY81_23505 [Rhizobium sp. R72]OWW02017.1 hypothetical protein ATY80_23505 [Rhizobium sp. R711]
MKPFEVFISYTHADEWLKDELLRHFAGLRKSGLIDVWHDRLIPPGGIIDAEIDLKIRSADIVILLVSTDFIASDYCFGTEYKIAEERHSRGEAELVPVLVRDCDWDVGGLRKFNAIPPDGIPVTRGALGRDEAERRDAAWLKVINGIKTVIGNLKKKLTPQPLDPAYRTNLFSVDFIRHPQAQPFNELAVFIDPDVYSEQDKQQLTSLSQLVERLIVAPAAIITGDDRSGKSLLAKKLQIALDQAGFPAVLLKGTSISNVDIEAEVRRSISRQYGLSHFPETRFTIIIDDFDECVLPDRVKEIIIRKISSSYRKCIVTSFTSAPSVLYTADDLPNPATFNINPFQNEKVLQLVARWKGIGLQEGLLPADKDVLEAYEKIQLIFGQTEIEKSPYSVITFLELLDSASGNDIAISSFAACYDALIQSRLVNTGQQWIAFDEYKNFLSLIAYTAYLESADGQISREKFDECVDIFETQFLSSGRNLRKMATPTFLRECQGGYEFAEDYLWFFLCARYVAKTLSKNDHAKYIAFVENCTKNIFQKTFANIVIYIAYFNDDNFVISSLLSTLDMLFSKADDWVLSDKSKSMIVGLSTGDKLTIEARADVEENRVTLLKEKIADIIENAEDVVARYTLPFLDAHIADSEFVDEISRQEIDGDSYMKSVNALLRIHSVLGQILSGRSGTYGADVVLDCITRMVKASGRYASLNHAIAALLMYDKEGSLADIEKSFKNEKLTVDEKYQKVMRIFAFWSVYMSQAGLARYLSQPHSIRALDKLAQLHEADEVRPGEFIPFNFTSVLLIARLYSDGKLDKPAIEAAIERFGEHSSLLALMRVAVHIYSYYMPMTIQDKQWVSKNLKIPMNRIEVQRNKASLSKRLFSMEHKPKTEDA